MVATFLVDAVPKVEYAVSVAKGTAGAVSKADIHLDSTVTREVFSDLKWTNFTASVRDMTESYVESRFL